MQIHSDLSERVVIQHESLPWADSPTQGIQRKLLESAGAKSPRVTSIIRYAPGSASARHQHDLGEEILVLAGRFEDDSGDFGPGSYIKIPSGSAHAGASRDGCLLFVKSHHLDPEDKQAAVVNSRAAGWFPGMVPGLEVLPLGEFGVQHTALVRWAPATRFSSHRHFGGEEIFVLDGVFEDEFGRYPTGTWIRSPHLSAHQPFSSEGCTILVKTGHLMVNPVPAVHA